MSYQQDKFCAWCGGEGSEEHHLIRRSQATNLIDDPENKIVLCRRDHEYATNVKAFETLLIEKFFLREKEPELSLEYIQNKMRSQETLSPKKVSDYIRFLAAEQSYNTELLEYVMKNKPPIYAEIKSHSKSIAEADREWECSEAGIKQNELESIVDRCKILKSSLRIIFDLYNGERFNQI